VQRLKTRTALRESLARLSTIMASSPAGIYLTDEKGDCIFVNQKWCTMTGLGPQEAGAADGFRHPPR